MVTILVDKIKRGFKSLRWTLIVTYMCIGFIPLIFFSNTVFKTMDKYFVEERKKELLSQANVVSGHITISNYLLDASKSTLFEYDISQSGKQGGYRIIVIDSAGTVVCDSNKTEVGKFYIIPEVTEALNSKNVAREQPNGTIYAAVPIITEQSQKIGVVLIIADASDIAVTINDIKKQIYVLLGALLFIVIIVIFFISQIFTEPLKSVFAVIKKMSDGHLDQRVPIKDSMYHNEIADLAEACNIMADKLEQVETTRQHFVSNVSHELKTPLSSIKVLSESILLQEDVPKEMYIEFLQDINSEVDRMTAIINDLLTLVRLDQKEVPICFKPTSINKLASDIIKRLSPLAQAKSINITFENENDITAEIDETKFTLAVSNLIENAIKYTPDGGSVKVSVASDHQNAFITVSDTGIGIAESEFNKIFERFYRVDKTRDRQTGGTGLGLSITHSTVLIHNGSIKVQSKEDEGTTFIVRIPIKNS